MFQHVSVFKCRGYINKSIVPLWRGLGGGIVQTGKIVYKTKRKHGLHFTAKRTLYAVESDKPNRTEETAIEGD